MKYLRLFINGDYITPNVCVNRQEKSIILEPKKLPSMFPLYLTTDREWVEDTGMGKAYYWEVDLPDDKLYNILIDAMVATGYDSGAIEKIPSEWLEKNLIYINNYKLNRFLLSK